MEGQQQAKVIVVGNSGVGKSCLLLRFVNNEFNEFSQPTLGAAFVSKIHHYQTDKKMRFQVWDTAGQEKYRSIASIYYRESQAALCVYDITKKSSFQIMKTWIQELKKQAPPQLILAVVGNKIDLADHEEVPYAEAKQYAQSIGAMFKLTSAKEGKGINQLFTSIAQKLEGINMKKTAATQRLSNKVASEPKPKKKCCE